MKDVVPQGGWAVAQQMRQAPAVMESLSLDQLVAQVALIQQAMQTVMKDGEHFGKIPGAGDKKCLFKSGAEKLALLFRLDPQYESIESWDGKHLSIKSKCTLYHIPTGQRLGSGEGYCSTKESKYGYRTGKRACPKCGAEAINRSKYPDRGAPANSEPGWYCFAKQGGCGAQFVAQDSEILKQQTGRVENPDIADQYNTVLKMGNKRSLVAAVLNVTAASDLFTQDLEELMDYQPQAAPPEPEPAKRYTPEERERYAAKPEASKREKPQEDPPSAGFGEPTPDQVQKYGPPVGQKEIKAFWASVDARAKDIGLPKQKEEIGRAILNAFSIEHSRDIGRDIFDEMILMIANFQPADLPAQETPK